MTRSISVRQSASKTRVNALTAVFAAVIGAAFPASAQDYPSRVVTVIVPYPAGGPDSIQFWETDVQENYIRFQFFRFLKGF